MTVLVVLEAVVLALLALLVAGLLRSHAEILRALHDLGVGPGAHDSDESVATGVPRVPALARSASSPERAPGQDVVGESPTGGAVVVGIAGAPQPTLLAFLSSGCITCHGFWETFADPRLALPGGARLVVVTMGPEAESASAITGLAPDHVLVVMSSDAWDEYGVPGSPYFVYIDGAAGTIVGEGTAPDWAQVMSLMTNASDDGALAASTSANDARKGRAARRRLDDREREARADAALLSAGIHPGDPRLGGTEPTANAPEES